MTATMANDYTSPGLTLRELWPAAVAHMKKNLPQIVVFAVIGAVGSYVVNIYWIAKRYEGTNVPSGAPVTTQSAFTTGMIFWILASSVIFGLIGHRRAVGGTQFWIDVRGMPASIAGIFRGDRSGIVHLLWGFAVSIVLTGILAPSLRGVLAVGVALTIPSVLGRVLMSYVSRIWSGVLRKLNPDKEHPPVPIVAPAVAGFGAAAAMAVGFLADDTVVQLVLAAVAAGAAIFVSQQRKAPPSPSTDAMTTLVLLAFGGLVLLAVAAGGPRTADADDGGYEECGSSWSEWWDCDGSDRVRDDSRWGGLAGGVGGVIGGGLLPGLINGANQAAGGAGGGGGGRPNGPSGRDPDGDLLDTDPDDGSGSWDEGDVLEEEPGWWDEAEEGDVLGEGDRVGEGDGVEAAPEEEPGWWDEVDDPDVPEAVSDETSEVWDDVDDGLVSAWDPHQERFRQVTPEERERLEADDRDIQRGRRRARDEATLADIRADRARAERLAERLARRDELERRLSEAEVDSDRWNDPDYWRDRVTEDAFDGMVRDVDGLPEEFRELGRAINEEMNDPENWRVLEETLSETTYDAAGLVSPIPFGDGADNIAETGRQVGEFGRAVGNAFAEDPAGFVYGMTPLQDLEDAMDPDKTLGERLGHLGAGLVDMFGGAGAGAAGDANRLAQAADAARDAERAADAADAARDAARAAEAAEAARDVDRAAEAAEAARGADRAAEAAEAARDLDRGADAGEAVHDAGRAGDLGEDLGGASRTTGLGDTDGLGDDLAGAGRRTDLGDTDDLVDAGRGADLGDADDLVGTSDADRLAGADDDLLDGVRGDGPDGADLDDARTTRDPDGSDDIDTDPLDGSPDRDDVSATGIDELEGDMVPERGATARDAVEEQLAGNRAEVDKMDLDDAERARHEAWEQNRREGSAMVDDFTTIVDDPPDLSPEEMAAMRRQAALDVQGNKQALQDMKGQSDAVKEAFNSEMRAIYDETDRDMLEWTRNHVDDLQSGPLRDVEIKPPITEVKVDRTKPPVGMAIYEDAAGNRIMMFEPTNPKPGGVSVGADRDFAVYIEPKDGARVPIDHRASGRAYNDSFYDHAGGQRTMEQLDIDPVTPETVTDALRERHPGLDDAEVARRANADALAERLDQAITDDLHPEAYTNVDRVIGRPFAPLDDAEQVGMTATYKGDHWAERAAHSDGPLSESELAEGFRQITKQHGNQIEPRLDQLQQQVDYLKGRGVLPESTGPIRQHPALERGVEIMERVNNEGLSPVVAERMLRDELGMTPRDVHRMAGEQLHAMNDLIPSEVKDLQHRMNAIADDLGDDATVDAVWAELRRRDGQ